MFAALRDLLPERPRLLVLTGAGCSTASGIPDYRDTHGAWKRAPPMHFPEFVGDAKARKRYWARSMAGWRAFSRARPNAVHARLANMERNGLAHHTITQNVDGLHQRAGTTRVTDLHGRLGVVRCLGCGATSSRDALQAELEARNPAWSHVVAGIAPDGDVDLEQVDYDAFHVPPCATCGGVLKPDVVFFGENVPRTRVEFALARLREADALLVVGSSLMVYSGFRFARAAAAAGQPIAIINRGRTRADELAHCKIDADANTALAELAHCFDCPGRR